MNSALQNYKLQIKTASPDFNEQDLDRFIRELSVRTLCNKALYSEIGEIPQYIGVVMKGLLKAVHINEEGKETNINFIREQMIVGHYQAFREQIPSRYRYQCLEPCTIVEIPFQHWYDCIATMPALERYVRLGMEQALYDQLYRIDALLIQNAQLRYQDFIRRFPELLERVSLSDLSSYLGIQRQSLTRIRRRLLGESG